MKGLLLAGTELGVYISFNDGKNWEKFNLNMPVLAITDLMIKHDDLIVATQGRSFWILDDMGLIRQLNGESGTKLYNPENSTIGNWYSQLNSNYSDGTSTFTGVNPANGVVIYYNISEEDENKKVIIKIYDEDFLYGGGLSVRSSLNTNVQKIADISLKFGLLDYDKRNGYRGVIANIRKRR